MGYKCYRLGDLQSIINVKSSPGEILSIQPLQSNYLIEIIKNRPNRICEVYNKFNNCTGDLLTHLTSESVYYDCLLKLDDKDVELINNYLKTLG